jgi:uncharacterized membrane protein YbhN (UPF0104 family)
MPSEHTTHSPARHYAFIAGKLVVSVALLWWLFGKIDIGLLWANARRASIAWLAAAMLIYTVNVIVSTWRWKILLHTQDVRIPDRRLLASLTVALFFNNFLPSNIGGDVIRIRDSAKPAGSKTIATLVILADRVIGLLALVLVAALGATAVRGIAGHAPAPIWPSWLWAGLIAAAAASSPAILTPAWVGRMLQPLTVLHPEWIGSRIDSLTNVLENFRRHPASLAACFGGAVFVQATIVVVYLAVARSLGINVAAFDLAVIVPISFIVQMLPVSVNGFGVREATFSYYFTRIGQPIESALLLSLLTTAVIMLFSLTGAVVYVVRGRH